MHNVITQCAHFNYKAWPILNQPLISLFDGGSVIESWRLGDEVLGLKNKKNKNYHMIFKAEAWKHMFFPYVNQNQLKIRKTRMTDNFSVALIFYHTWCFLDFLQTENCQIEMYSISRTLMMRNKHIHCDLPHQLDRW